ncbi:MAG: hypothetical protein FWE36_06950 [Erysipelotrichales bacterium]|nr:hypothetical protein [Erysipelotrichales bacterium]
MNKRGFSIIISLIIVGIINITIIFLAFYWQEPLFIIGIISGIIIFYNLMSLYAYKIIVIAHEEMKYVIVIEKGKSFLKWNIFSLYRQFIILLVASSYFALSDNQKLETYLLKVKHREALGAKYYYLTILSFIKNDLEAAKLNYDSFLTAIKSAKGTNYEAYKKILDDIFAVLEDKDNEAKNNLETLASIAKNSEFKDFLEKLI